MRPLAELTPVDYEVASSDFVKIAITRCSSMSCLPNDISATSSAKALACVVVMLIPTRPGAKFAINLIGR
jgi:hypothetical protein